MSGLRVSKRDILAHAAQMRVTMKSSVFCARFFWARERVIDLVGDVTCNVFSFIHWQLRCFFWRPVRALSNVSRVCPVA